MRYVYIIAILSVLVAVKAGAYMILMGANLGALPNQINTCPTGVHCYYFAQSGNDSTGAGTTAAPWKTAAKANGMLSTLSPGDELLFKGGDTWNEKIYLGDIAAHAVVGSPTSHVHIGSWGVGQAIFDELNNNQDCIGATNPLHTNSGTPSFPVNYLTIDNIVCRHGYNSGIQFIAGSGFTFKGITVSNSLIEDNVAHCATVTGNCAPVTAGGGDDLPDAWVASTTYHANSSSHSGILYPRDSPKGTNSGKYWYTETVSTCMSGSVHPTWPQSGTCTGVVDGSCRWDCTGAGGEYNQELQMVDSSGASGSDIQMIGNTVRSGGGHNTVQIHGITGTVDVENNDFGPGGLHGVFDIKLAGNATTHALIKNNRVHGGSSLNMIGCQNTTGSANCVTGTGLWTDNFLFMNPFTNKTAYYDIIGNTLYDTGVCAQLLPNATGSGCGVVNGNPTCPEIIKFYNNTCYANGLKGSLGLYAGNSAFNGTIDFKKNICDNAAGSCISVQSGWTSASEDCNNVGGSHTSHGFSFNGSTTRGPNDLFQSDPLYVNAAAFNFSFLSGSSSIGAGSNCNTPGSTNTNIGSYVGAGQ